MVEEVLQNEIKELRSKPIEDNKILKSNENLIKKDLEKRKISDFKDKINLEFDITEKTGNINNNKMRKKNLSNDRKLNKKLKESNEQILSQSSIKKMSVHNLTEKENSKNDSLLMENKNKDEKNQEIFEEKNNEEEKRIATEEKKLLNENNLKIKMQYEKEIIPKVYGVQPKFLQNLINCESSKNLT